MNLVLHLKHVKNTVEYRMNDLDNFIDCQKKYGSINIETSNRCPLLCPQCTRANLFQPKNSRQYEDITRRIKAGFDLPLSDSEKLLKFSDNEVYLCGQLSDPVYWKYFFDFLLLTQKYKNIKLGIHTAASQKNLEWYREAFKQSHTNVVWRFGIDGFEDTSPIYRKNQNTKLLFEAMLLGKSMGIAIEWHFIVFEHNEHQIDRAKDYAKKHSIDLFFVKSNRKGGGVSIPRFWRPENNKEVIKNNDSV